MKNHLKIKQRATFVVILIGMGIITHLSYRWMHPEWLAFRQADNYFRDKNWQDSIPFFEKSLALGINRPQVMTQIAHAYGQMKNYPKAIYWYQKYLSINPNQLWARKALAGMLTANGEFDKAAEQYRLILEIEGNKVDDNQ